jgi:hypothetical protein
MPVGPFWLEIARLVIEGMAMAGEKASPVRPKGSIQQLARASLLLRPGNIP